MMAKVGIIANPASGKDIRRLIAQGSVFTNLEKVNIVRRVLLSLQAMDIEEAIFMPDYFGIGLKAVDGLHLTMSISTLEMKYHGDQTDTTIAAALMAEKGVGCIVTLGGDGTNRAVAKSNILTPLMPISTGTNNVFPLMVEGTIAGLAAAIVANQSLPNSVTCQRQNRFEIILNNQLADIALVDVAVYDDRFIGSRAVWDMSKVRSIFLTRTEAGHIGLSSVAGSLSGIDFNSREGMYVELGDSDLQVIAPIAPGRLDRISITSYQKMKLADSIEVHQKPSVLALDGEREVEVRQDDRVLIRFSDEGPYVVDVQTTMNLAASNGLFIRHANSSENHTR